MGWSIGTISDFKSLERDWARINEAGANTPLLDPCFIVPLFDGFASGSESLAVFSQDGRIKAIGVFERRRRHVWQSFQPVVSPLGTWVCEPGLDMRHVLGGLVGALPGFGLLVALSQQDPSLARRPDDAGIIRTVDYIPTARLNIDGSFDDYWGARGKNLKHTVKRQRNKLSRDGVSARLEILTEKPDMARAVADYGRVESSGWKGRQDSAVRPDNALGRYYITMLEAFCKRGQGLVYRYLYDDRVVATDLCIHRDGTLFILKTTYDEAERATSPAQLMRNEAFRRFFDDGNFTAIEFYGRVMDWHTKLTDDVRTMYHINCYRYGLISRLHKPEATDEASRYAS